MTTFITRKGMDLQVQKARAIIRNVQELQKRAKEALEQSPGDGPHDNAPYDAVRNEIDVQKRLLRDNSEQLSDCVIMEYPTKLDFKVVQYGAGVIFDRDGEKYDFKLVGLNESDINRGRMFYKAPLAIQLIGHKEGDIFKVTINNRVSEIKIKKIYL